MSRSSEIRQRLAELLVEGEAVQQRLVPVGGKDLPNHLVLVAPYQKWYSAASEVVRVLLPGRADEFQRLYDGKKTASVVEYGISMWLKGEQLWATDEITAATQAFQLVMTQVAILEAAEASVDSVLFDIEGVVQADLFSNELDAAKELQKEGHLRAAGMIAGVVVERHMKQVASHHKFPSRKKKPTLNDFNEFLKSEGVIRQNTWRFVQQMGDLRNLCAHPDDEPTKQDITDLIAGAKKVQAEIS